jgi:hypothetical protein
MQHPRAAAAWAATDPSPEVFARHAGRAKPEQRAPGLFPGAPRISSSQQRQGDRQMITFVPKPNGVPAKPAEESRFDRIRRIAADKHRRTDAGTIRREPPKTGGKRPM